LAGLEPNELGAVFFFFFFIIIIIFCLDSHILDDLQLNSDPSCYAYLSKSSVYKVDGTNDVYEFQKTKVRLGFGFSFSFV
jgi:hypothetical protein